MLTHVQILEAFHHPYYATGRSEIQNRMFDEMKKWMGEMGGEAQDIIKALTKVNFPYHLPSALKLKPCQGCCEKSQE